MPTAIITLYFSLTSNDRRKLNIVSSITTSRRQRTGNRYDKSDH